MLHALQHFEFAQGKVLKLVYVVQQFAQVRDDRSDVG
jgi:hypothetical protein